MRSRRDGLIIEHLKLVPPIARRVKTRLPPSFELADLISEGTVGLIHAADRYCPRSHNGTPFSAYARQRIHGAIVDSVRRKCWVENTAFPLDDAPEPVSEPDRPYLIKGRHINFDVSRRPVMQFPGFNPHRLPKPLAVALERLTARQRAVLRAFYGDAGGSLEESARLLGLTPAEAEAEHRTALDFLHAALLRNVSLIGSTLVYFQRAA